MHDSCYTSQLMRTPEAIRGTDVGFKNEANRYYEAIDRAVLPEQLKHLRHALSWPVDMANPIAHISCHFGDQNYASNSVTEPHDGIDIQLPRGTEVIAPEDLRLVSIIRDFFWDVDRDLVELTLHGENGIAYCFAHLDSRSIPGLLKRKIKLLDYKFDPNSRTLFKQGDLVGKVGLWFDRAQAIHGHTQLPEDKEIPEDVLSVYGRTYDHIHITTQSPQHNTFSETYHEKKINPVLLLKKLY
jgi:hypothetical protein